MARFDVYPMPGRGNEGYIIDVQADLLSNLATRTVIPLLPEKTAPRPISELNPKFDIEGKRYILLTQSIASIQVNELKCLVGSLADRHDDIIRALDTLLTGF